MILLLFFHIQLKLRRGTLEEEGENIVPVQSEAKKKFPVSLNNIIFPMYSKASCWRLDLGRARKSSKDARRSTRANPN